MELKRMTKKRSFWVAVFALLGATGYGLAPELAAVLPDILSGLSTEMQGSPPEGGIPSGQ